MDRIVLDLPTAVPTIAADCLTRISAVNNEWTDYAKIIMGVFLCLGLLIGGIFGYLYGVKHGR